MTYVSAASEDASRYYVQQAILISTATVAKGCLRTWKTDYSRTCVWMSDKLVLLSEIHLPDHFEF